ncbi:hypothetical protein [Sphingomonas sp. NFR15]|uniref:hypothetical protein n=1 Tax=Sphingomonas sp. NFR15 TaxID=1566282 RepID=UPI00088F84DD|nr:hypothetical protein [Sphingomonas sp. NFR15]SDA34798.1 hypothetical protein SAMN03159340_03105 [Sphingomonas sp. NFR15]
MRACFLSAVALSLAVAGCVAPAPPPPRPAPVVAARPVAPPPPSAPPPPATSDWRDWPLTPGDWVYRRDARGSLALYGMPGSDAVLTLRCDAGARMVYLSRAGAGGAGAATIRTTSTARTLSLTPTGGATPYLAVALTPRDSLLDAMAFSRGRFVIEQAGYPTLVIPAWAEIGRVTEDCRT